jgi:nucleoside-diphosphate-sugar epimerase
VKIVVTGGAGFVGRHVAAATLAAGHECRVLDVVDIPADLAAAGGCWNPGSLLSIDDVRQAFRGADAVLHLAGVGDVYLAAEKPALAAELNVVGSANVAEACLAEGVGRLVYASTWEVYGQPRYEPLDENHPTNPDHPYNVTKRAGEQLLLAYDALKGLPVVALRLGTAYGTGMRPNSVFSIFITRALRGEPITVSGDGRQHRQFTHASDIGRAFIAAAESDLRHEVLNIVADETVSIRQLAEMIVAEAPVPLSFGDPRPGDISPARVSAAKAHDLLGWSAHVPFAQGLRELIEHHRGPAR